MSEHENPTDESVPEVEPTEEIERSDGSDGSESTDGASAEQAVMPPVQTPRGFHPVNVGHLVLGTAFVGLVVVWALVTSDTVELVDAHWLLPLPWLVAGVVGLLATVLRNAGRRRTGKMSGWT